MYNLPYVIYSETLKLNLSLYYFTNFLSLSYSAVLKPAQAGLIIFFIYIYIGDFYIDGVVVDPSAPTFTNFAGQTIQITTFTSTCGTGEVIIFIFILNPKERG
jgi:hypothetical protein